MTMFCLSTVIFRDLLAWVPTTLGSLLSVCNSPLFHLFQSSLICRRSACKTTVSVSMSFGGQSWPINPVDFNVGPISSDGVLCQGAIFDLSEGSNNKGNANPSWVVGDTFLVRNLSHIPHILSLFFLFFYRKTCTRCSVPHQRLLGLPSCLQRLVDQVRNPLGSIGFIYTHICYHL